MDKEQALDMFWNSFGIPAFDEASVPDEVWSEEQQKMVPLDMPYITYSVATGSLDDVISLTASLWYRSTSWKEITQKKNNIAEYIGVGGRNIPIDDGYMYIYRGSTFAQRILNNELTKQYYLQVQIEFLTEN